MEQAPCKPLPFFPMTCTYTWIDVEQTVVKREDEEGNVCFIPVCEGNRDYKQFVEETGGVADPFIVPAPPAPLTTEEKVNKLLSDYGLTRTELRTALAKKQTS